MNNLISNKIKYIYWFLTLGMVMYHARWLDYFNIEYLNVIDRKLLTFYFRFAEHIGTVCMTFFFFMSAFWFYKGINSNKDILIKCKKRLKTLLIPFLLWTIILGLYKIANSEISLAFNKIFYYLFESPVAGPLWYILGLLILQFLSPILILFKKNKKLTTALFSIGITYVFLRNFNIIPHIFSFKNWWWYNNLIHYLPAYLIGAYIGLYFPGLLIEKKYEKKSHTVMGIGLLIICFFLWHYFNDYRFILIYALVELLGIWLMLKPSVFKRTIPMFLSCEFYVFALHNPILIPKTKQWLISVLGNTKLSGIEVVFVKTFQILLILLLSCVIRFLIRKLLPKIVDQNLTGGR